MPFDRKDLCGRKVWWRQSSYFLHFYQKASLSEEDFQMPAKIVH